MSKPDCLWCEQRERNGCEPRACFHHPAQGTALAAQARVEEWLRAAPTDVDSVLAVVLADDLKAAE